MTKILMDSCVVFDWYHADEMLFRKLSVVCTVCLMDALQAELGTVDLKSPAFEHVKWIEATAEDIDFAAAQEPSALSWYDQIFYSVSSRLPFDLVLTNDKRLRRNCSQAGQTVHGGLYPLVLLVQHGQLSQQQAKDFAKKIHENNPRISKEVLEDFNKLLADNGRFGAAK